MTTTPFQKNLAWSAGLHIAALVAFAFLLGFSHTPKPPETVQWVDLAPIQGEPGPVESQPVTPSLPKFDPIPEPVRHDPVEPAPIEPVPESAPIEPVQPDSLPIKKVEPSLKAIKKPEPAPKVEQPPQPKIKISAKRVVKSVTGQSSANDSSAKPVKVAPSQTFSKSLLAKLEKNGGLVVGADASGTGASPAGEESKFAAYKNLIEQELYRAWRPPLGMDEGMGAKVLLRIEKTGVISVVSLAASSGNKELDDTALKAPQMVKKLPPLPEGMGAPKPYVEVIVFFKIKKL